MKNILILFFILSTQLAAANELKNITNFTGDKDEVRELFDLLWGRFKSFDNYHCYRRAHILSYQLEKENIISGKAFFFKGDKHEMPKNWYYHVAPYILYNGEEVVLDKGLFDGATYLKDWLLAFSENNKCLRIYSYDEYLKNKSSEICMYFLAERFYYGPLNLKENLNSYNNADLADMLFSLSPRMRKKYLNLYPIN